MYRKASSGRFIGLSTFLIVIVMAVFTWVMYGMAQQVFVMTDIMVELSDSFRSMVKIQKVMVADIHSMSTDINEMNHNVGYMSESVGDMSGSIGSMSTSVVGMGDAVNSLAGSVGRMSYDLSKASYAMSNPMSFMWGNSSPFPF